MTLATDQNKNAQGYRKNAIGSGIGTLAEDRISLPGVMLSNRQQAGDDQFRLPEDGYIQLVSQGEFPVNLRNGEERMQIIQVIDETALNRIMENFSGELLINYEHFAHYADKESRAAGWIQGIEKRADGIWGKVRWSNSGKRDVTGGDYRYISPEFEGADTEHLGGNRYRINRLDGAGLTNSPNMKTLKPLSNRRRDTDQNQPSKTMNEKLLNRLRRFFGLAEDANEDAILNAVPADNTHAQLTGLQEENTRLVNREQELLGQLADKDLEGFDLDDDRKKIVRNGLINNREATLAILGAAPKKDQTPPGTIFNRKDAKTPASIEDAAAVDKVLAGKIANRADEIFKAGKDNGVTMRGAFEQAASELSKS